ncbi:uncharacterized protein LOC108312039 [Cebus imitator]|uniref:uncharacterized protein LOC108312039 n=1 Tax=Cebus imitator TaxID=2715852 RepID=UPI001896C8A3|nr:uncharacterized protein LOC108312039 [Cebus imitator]
MRPSDGARAADWLQRSLADECAQAKHRGRAWPRAMGSCEGATGRLGPRLDFGSVGVKDIPRTESLPITASQPYCTSRSPGASQPGLAAGPGSPAVPGLAGVWAAASVTPARSGPSRPVHLNKLPLTGAQSLWSRRPPVASLLSQLSRAGSGQLAGMGRGTRG